MTTSQAEPAIYRPVADPNLTLRRSALVSGILRYVVVGAVFAVLLIKAEVVSWYRIQEMFRFQSFHMYGVLGTAILVAFVSVQVLQRFHLHAVTGEPISIPKKEFGRGYRYWAGGMIFGLGWALTGACPGPLFALIGSGGSVFAVVGVAALLGTWTYGFLRPRLPH